MIGPMFPPGHRQLVRDADYAPRRVAPITAEMTNRTRKIKNRILAMPAAEAAMPPNPRTAAMTATTRKTSVQLSMSNLCQQGPRRGLRLLLPGISTGGDRLGSSFHSTARFIGRIMDTPRFRPGHAAGVSSQRRDHARGEMTDRRIVIAWGGDQRCAQRIEPLLRRFEFRSPATLRDVALRTTRSQPAPHDHPHRNGGLRDAAGRLFFGVTLLSGIARLPLRISL